MSREKKEVILEAQRDKKKVHFATLMDICHLKNAELDPKLQKRKGRVVLRGGVVKDDSGAYAVFTEQGSSASKMTAAKVIDVIARVLDCDGQAADAVSAHTQVKLEDSPRLLNYTMAEILNIEDPVVPLERNLNGHPFAGLLWERQFEEVLLDFGWDKVPTWECLFVHRNQGSFLSVYVDDIKMAGKSKIWLPRGRD